MLGQEANDFFMFFLLLLFLLAFVFFFVVCTEINLHSFHDGCEIGSVGQQCSVRYGECKVCSPKMEMVRRDNSERKKEKQKQMVKSEKRLKKRRERGRVISV